MNKYYMPEYSLLGEQLDLNIYVSHRDELGGMGICELRQHVYDQMKEDCEDEDISKHYEGWCAYYEMDLWKWCAGAGLTLWYESVARAKNKNHIIGEKIQNCLKKYNIPSILNKEYATIYLDIKPVKNYKYTYYGE